MSKIIIKPTMVCIFVLFVALLSVSVASIVSTAHASSVPTITFAEKSGNTVKITMSEAVYADSDTTAIINAFEILSCGAGSSVSATGVSGLATSSD